ncbi:hypothetical protein BJY01DRAFT_248407 [Aspergillus pseudoustus]|uniref:Fungal N-terminal domain-containing protein n=1 Tax=Aspergillus pseudoustus TaxID=1810923 RepID=A0ABR4JWH8_9EURO
MVDPFSIASAIMGIAAVSCQIIQLITKFGLDWRDAPKDIRAYHAELESLDTLSKFLSTELVCNPDLISDVVKTQSLVDACRLELDRAKRLRDAMDNLQRQYNVMNQIVNVGSAAQGLKLRKELQDSLCDAVKTRNAAVVQH